MPIDSSRRLAYHGGQMDPARRKNTSLKLAPLVRLLLAAMVLFLVAPAMRAADPEIFPLSQVKPGMKGEALTIFAGDQVEKFDLVVIGVMPNFLGPKESVILVQLVRPNGEHTGLVAWTIGCSLDFNG